jgi:protein SCO1
MPVSAACRQRKEIMRQYGLLAGVGIIAGVLLMSAFVLTRPHTFRGSVIEPPIPAPPIVLEDGRGATFRLSDHEGSLVLIFFGYTACPDVCPVSLSEMKQIQRRLGNRADNVRFVMITVDPDRDTPEKTAQYVASFDPSFIGLSGTTEALDPVWKAYGVYHEKRETGSAAGYLVDHSSFMYVIDKAGNLRETFSFGTPVNDIVEDLRYLSKER